MKYTPEWCKEKSVEHMEQLICYSFLASYHKAMALFYGQIGSTDGLKDAAEMAAEIDWENVSPEDFENSGIDPDFSTDDE